MKSILGIGFCLLLIAGCKPDPHQAKIDTLDSLRSELAHMRGEFEQLDTASIASTYSIIAANLDSIKLNLRDTLSYDQAHYMSDYYQIRKPMKTFKSSYTMLLAELEYTESQLKDLAIALDKGSLTDEQALSYFELEKTSAQTLLQTMSDKIKQMKDVQIRFDTLHPKVKQFLNEVAVKESDIQ